MDHPTVPAGVATPATARVGDPVLLNDLGAASKPPGTLTYFAGDIYRLSGAVIPFDSGGPIVDERTGEALGLVSRGLNCQAPSLLCAEYEGPTVQDAMALAQAKGFLLDLRTAGGD